MALISFAFLTSLCSSTYYVPSLPSILLLLLFFNPAFFTFLLLFNNIQLHSASQGQIFTLPPRPPPAPLSFPFSHFFSLQFFSFISLSFHTLVIHPHFPLFPLTAIHSSTLIYTPSSPYPFINLLIPLDSSFHNFPVSGLLSSWLYSLLFTPPGTHLSFLLSSSHFIFFFLHSYSSSPLHFPLIPLLLLFSSVEFTPPFTHTPFLFVSLSFRFSHSSSPQFPSSTSFYSCSSTVS